MSIPKIVCYLKELITEKEKMEIKSKQKLLKALPKTSNNFKVSQTIVGDIEKVEILHSLIKRYDHKKKFKMEILKRELVLKQKKLKAQEQRQKHYLSFIRQAEAERRSSEIRRVKKIALFHVYYYYHQLFLVKETYSIFAR